MSPKTPHKPNYQIVTIARSTAKPKNCFRQSALSRSILSIHILSQCNMAHDSLQFPLKGN